MARIWIRAGIVAGVLALGWMAVGRSTRASAQQWGPVVTGAHCNMADVVPDGHIDVADMQAEASYYATVAGGPGYNPRYNINDPWMTDEWIDILDIQFVYGLFGMTCMPPPSVTRSWYMRTVDPSTLSQQGCSQAQAGETGLVILDFGQPWVQGGVYGTIVFDGVFASTAEIAAAAESFASGYYACAWIKAPSLSLAIGTNNYVGTGAAVTYGHGQAWAALVNQVAAYVQGSYGTVIPAVYGANDIETGWSSASSARSWVDGYASSALYQYVDYGDAGGCPSYPYPGWTPPYQNAGCDNLWTQLDVWYVAWGAPYADDPVPDIYVTNRAQAGQWASINNLDHLTVQGEMTQLGACQWLQQHQQGSCTPDLENWPSYAWAQLYFALTSTGANWWLSPPQQPYPPWSTDITYSN